MSFKTSPPMPVYPTSRLVGVEIEIDVGKNREFKELRSPTGWTKKSDVSLANGVELVLEPPRALPDAIPVINRLCEKLVDYNVLKSGGLHVHVQIADYSHDDAHDLVKLYSHFQPVINKLVGQSRVGNKFCMAYPPGGMSKFELIREFELDDPAFDRARAKSARKFRVINLAMMRCRNPGSRSAEFRQGSVSKRAICVGGWATLMVALVDIAKVDKEAIRLLPRSTGKFKDLFDSFLELLMRQEERVIGSKGVAQWVDWRYEYLNGRPTAAQLKKLVKILMGGYKGLFTVSRQMDTNLAHATELLKFAVEKGVAIKHANKPLWTVSYDTIAEEDLLTLERQARTAGTPIEEVNRDVEEAIETHLNPPPTTPVPANT